MSESLTQMETEQTQSEVDHVKSDHTQLDAQNVKKLLIRKRIGGMSRKLKLIWFLGILLLLGASGYGLSKWLGTSKSSDYLTATVAKTTLSDAIETTGTLEAVKSSDMGFKSDNTITAINVKPGDHVKQGDILAQQDPTTLQSALQQALSSVDQDQMNVNTSSLNDESNRKALDREQKLFEAGAATQKELEDAQDAYSKSQWDVTTAKAKLTNDEAKVTQSQSDLSGATLIAPFDGVIGAVNGQVGQINGLTNSSSSTLLTIMSEDLQLSALVNEADIGRIKVDQAVEFTTSAYSSTTFKGKVLRITPQAKTVSSVQYYPVLISVEDPNKQLLSGMSVSANIIVSRKADVLAVPMMTVSYAQTYLKANPQSSTSGTPATTSTTSTTGGTQAVVLVMKNNVPVATTVVLGLNDGSKYEIIQGLSAGEQVIVGSNTVDSSSSSTSSSSSSSSSKSSKSQSQNAGGMGGPPPGM